MLDDYEVLVAIGKGSYWLKLKKLRAMGYIKGSIPKMELTDDGKAEVKNPVVLLRLTKARRKNIEMMSLNLATHFYGLFSDPKNQGPNFVWPDTLKQVVTNFAEIHADTNNLSRFKPMVVATANRYLETLLKSAT